MLRTAARCIALAIGLVLTFPIHSTDGQTRSAGPRESRYAREWQEIDSLTAEGLPQLALRSYVKTTWTADQIRPVMGTVSVTNDGGGYVTGALHWQYLERPDRVAPAGSALRVQKTLLLRKDGPGGTFAPITPDTRVAVGDLVQVRLEVQTDQPLSFVHVKDPRAAGLEPVQVLSGYANGRGLGYYQTTHDAASHFFLDHLPGGKHVLEYELRVTHAGTFSGGPATVQCMYAPEYAAHSRGVGLKVE